MVTRRVKKSRSAVKYKISPLVFIFAAGMLLLGRGYVLVGYFVAVVMHEMAHAEVARRKGYVLVQIKIMPYGASLTGEFEGINWKDEFWIAVAGPLANVGMGVLFTAVWWLAPATYFFTETFVLANIFTALTNVLPVFPLDGGRALLAVMSRKVPRERAYRILRVFGLCIGAAFCVLFALSLWYGGNITLAFMAIFVLVSTVFPDKNSKYQRLYSMAYRSEKLKHGLTVRETMVADSLTLSALQKMCNGNYYQRFVLVNERLETVGVLTETRLERLLLRYPPHTAVSALPASDLCMRE